MAESVAVLVVVDTPAHSGVGHALSYSSERALSPGTLVRVPLGRRQVTGVVWAGEAPALRAGELRAVDEALAALAPLGEAWRALVAFAAGYYQRSVGEVALSVLPPELRKLGNLALEKRLKRLAKAPLPARKGREAGARIPEPAPEPAPAIDSAPELNHEQRAAVTALLAHDPNKGAVLLHGVTGSGKTEVYLHAAQEVLRAGRQVLVLVPEINLTPQLEARFAARFAGSSLVSLHSALTPAQRLRHWLLSHTGAADLVLGTRLAVFASLPRLGLIVVDEEHDPSYKQQEGARYSARDLAVYRGRQEQVPVLLGSATPSLESWQHAQTGRYRHLGLPTRIGGGTLPQVRVVDMNLQPRKKGDAGVLSPPLLAALRERVERGEQSLVLLNRRGYAPVLHCTACPWKSACAHCSAWRVFHKADRTLRCHHCGFTERVPRACPECGNLDIQPIGRGTERLEEQLAIALAEGASPAAPRARIARIDADSTRGKGALEAQLGAVHAGEVDILVGTQMVAKGHDFRRITLVAAVDADSALFASDFRAGERLFALLMQSAGRAGRDAAHSARSEMWIQTWHPRHALYAALRQHDFAAFARSQLAEREAASLPPFSSLALMRADAKNADAATAFLRGAAELAAVIAAAHAAEHAGAAGVTVFPPVPPTVARVADVERMQMLVESASRVALQRLLAAWLPQLHALRAEHKGVLRWAVDVDPLAI